MLEAAPSLLAQKLAIITRWLDLLKLRQESNLPHDAQQAPARTNTGPTAIKVRIAGF